MKVIVTHDIDSIMKPKTHVLARRERFAPEDIHAVKEGTRNLYYNLRDVVNFELDLGIKSTVFVPVFLFNIHRILDDLLFIQKEGIELQLHYVHDDRNPQYKGLYRLQEEYFQSTLGQRVQGVRCHNLFINDEILNLFGEERVHYDSTYRVEQVQSYAPFAIRSTLIELPIALMDADLFGRFHFSETEAWKYILRKMDLADENDVSYFTILFHQESFRMRGGRLYKRLAEHLRDNNVECTRCIDCYTEYVNRYTPP